MEGPIIEVRLLGGSIYGKIKGFLPRKMKPGDACYDICSVETSILEPNRRKLFETNLQFKIPMGYMGKIHPRSSMWQEGIDVLPGIIDSNYRGSLKVGLINNSRERKYISSGDRICQIIFNECKGELIEVEYIDTMSTVRGTQNFGSSNGRGSTRSLCEFVQNKQTI